MRCLIQLTIAVTVLAGFDVSMRSAQAAGVPDPANSTVPSQIVSSGKGETGVPPHTVAPQFVVTVRDLVSNPIAGATVTVSYNGTTTAKLLNTQPAPTVLSCPGEVISQTTNAVGQVAFRVRGGGYDLGNSITVRADNVFLRAIRGLSTDFNGDGVTNAVDLAIEAVCYLAPNEADQLKGDFNGDGVVVLDGIDLAIFASDWVNANPPGTFCP